MGRAERPTCPKCGALLTLTLAPGGVVTICQLEAGVNQPRRATLVVVRHTLAAAGVEFIEDNGGGVGVRFREARRERSHE